MAKKVLVLVASPRKGGNSDLLCDQFMCGAAEAGHDVEKIYLMDKRIEHCKACGVCKGNGGQCMQQDDMAEILDKIINADVIVMATPVYFYTMNGRMKTLIDRTYARYTRVSNKEMYFIITAAVSKKELLERTLDEFRGFTTCLNGPKIKGVIYGAGAWDMSDIKGSPSMNQAYEMGKES